MPISIRSGIAVVPASSTWKPLPVGAGGFLRSINLAILDNTMVCRTDTYGAYVWNPSRAAPNGSTGMWEQLCAPNRFPAGDLASKTPEGQEAFFTNGGAYEICIAPSNPSIFYMLFLGRLYRTLDRGANWQTTGFTPVTASEMPSNSNNAQFGQRMAIDPINPNRVIFGSGGSSAGVLFRTTDGGANVSVISTGQVASASAGLEGYAIVYDPRVSTQSGGNSLTVYAFSNGHGLYKSTDGGVTWTLQNSAGMPTTCEHLEINPANGDIWMTSDVHTQTNLWKYVGSTWTNVTAASASNGEWLGSIAIDPNNTNHMACFQQGSFPSYITYSTDGGATWSNGASQPVLVSNDVPWLSLQHGLNVGRAVYDNAGNVIISDGVAVWKMVPVASGNFNVVSMAAGIEQLITNKIMSPPGGNPLVLSWDRAAFVIVDPKKYPSTYYPGSELAGTAAEINYGWDADYATSDPSFVCVYADAVNGLFYSTNKGAAWSDYPNSPIGRFGGMIAASTPLNQIAGTSNNGTLYYTLDRGATAWVSLENYFFTNFSVPKIGPSVVTGWGNAGQDGRQYLSSDKVLASTFYAYNDGGGGAGGGIYRSIDGGQNWTLRNGAPGFLGNYGCLKSVPNIGSTSTANHLFFTAGIGNDPHPANQPFYRSSDGGASWGDVNILARDVFAFGFGKNDSGPYPAIGFYGWYNGVGGFHVSKDNGVSFTKIGELTLYGTSDVVDTVTGDSNTPNIWYVGLHNSGSAYYGP